MATARGDVNDDDLPYPTLPTTKTDDYVMVASIDFGTTFSGYAFSFKGSETDIKINKNWGDTLGFSSYKAPTSVLLNDKDQFDSFGYEAEENYVDIEDEEDSGFTKKLFRHFKMVLHSKRKITRKTAISSTNGDIFKAIDIFAHALRYLKDHLLRQLAKELKSEPDLSLIRWVITVPAIWSEESKQFMREAAFLASIIEKQDSTQLLIAIEPEVASFFCRQLDLIPFDTEEDINFPSGTIYLVLDCGGGTNDMVVHKVVLEHTIKEVCAINGGSAGGNEINNKFIDFLKEIFGIQFIDAFQKKSPDQWLSIMVKFENGKKKVHRDKKGKIRVELPFGIDRDYEQITGKRFAHVLNNAKEKGVVCAKGALVLSSDVVKALFRETIDKIVDGVRAVFQDANCKGIQYIFMVGGFSENEYLQAAIRQEFDRFGCTVLVPSEAQLAITKGAVLFGHYQNQVVSRIARRTYGTDCSRQFNGLIHDQKKMFIDEDNEKLCRDLFDVFVEIGDEIKIGSQIEKSYIISKNINSPKCTIFSVPRKPNKPAEYTDQPDVTKLGKITIKTPNPEGLLKRELILRMTFSSTEILCEAIDKTTGNTCSTTIDFLSE